MVYQINPDTTRPQGHRTRIDERNTQQQDTSNHGNQEQNSDRTEVLPSYFVQPTSDFDVLRRNELPSNQRTVHQQTQTRSSVIRDVGLGLRRIGDKWYVAKETGKELRKIADELYHDYTSPDLRTLQLEVMEGDGEDVPRRNS